MTITETPVNTKRRSQWSTIPSSQTARNTVNPIRAVVEKMQRARIEWEESQKSHSFSVRGKPQAPISLSIGDPTVFGNFKTHPAVNDAVLNQLNSYQANGYAPSYGIPTARAAVARKFHTPDAPLTPDDVILTSACSGALEMAIGSLADPGQNILVPLPGFPLYKTLAQSRGVDIREYRLLPERNWEVDLADFESLIDDNTAAVIINNPSNPCGSVFSRTHLLAILAVCERNHVPIIADEIYADIVFDSSATEGSIENVFYPISSLTQTVPILTVGGLAKQWLVPGWRMGWILIHDRQNLFSQVRKGLFALSTLILGPNTLIQAAIPDIFANVPSSFLQDTITTLSEHARVCQQRLAQIPGLKVVMPQGAMYMMVGLQMDEFRDIDNDVDFASRLNLEESVEVLPGQCFNYPNYFRIVLTPPVDKLEEACHRLERFCHHHHIH
ncbi:hypothetical protein IWQ62_001770 [Dispira parvispora]|uniref:Tyrosine aminotransferase n=1 Tax=Dispira parvispora TaxID=1520584 RepID=A0A9W8AXK8_9FUNG|nr:hypothetical protein IWQ62_001770 [Dispira parvispora]